MKFRKILLGGCILIFLLFLFFGYNFVKISGKVVNNLDNDFDLNGDGNIGLEDFEILNSNHDKVDCKSPDWCDNSDFNKDGIIDRNDFEILIIEYTNAKAIESGDSEMNFIEKMFSKENLISDFSCGDWSECNVEYNFEDLVQGNVLLKGERTRLCESEDDLDKIERESCESKIPILVKNVSRCFKNYVEVYDLEENLISRLELVKGDYKKLNIDMTLNNTSYCYYCYDGIKDYDEDEIDCVYSGDSCPICNEKFYKDNFWKN